EARITLAQATTYLATAPKSNASYLAVEEALADVRSGRLQAVPEHLKNVHVDAIGRDGLDDHYKYPHDFDRHTVRQNYMPANKIYYRPTTLGYEDTIGKRMEQVKRLKNSGGASGKRPPSA
ncbi:MAG: replication-associated recombination protein A, partial [Kiritimatiellae bacterium]|nr:replication-associated recombination protein A [Kiritimatiellia bacterium]